MSFSRADDTNHEWSRSRYWLCHFLHNRHVRSAIDWSDSTRVGDCPRRDAVLASFAQLHAIETHDPQPLIQMAVRFAHVDPAFVQSLRLCIREEQFHQQLLRAVLLRYDHDVNRTLWLHSMRRRARRMPGLRFELSVRLLEQIVAMSVYELSHMLSHEDRALRDSCSQIIRDKTAHVAFHAERLAMAYADFHFARRNLRRLRLRTMFTGLLAASLWRHAPLIHQADMNLASFITQRWNAFEMLLEQMVPYRRDALLALLMAQQDQPYAKYVRLHP